MLRLSVSEIIFGNLGLGGLDTISSPAGEMEFVLWGPERSFYSLFPVEIGWDPPCLSAARLVSHELLCT